MYKKFYLFTIPIILILCTFYITGCTEKEKKKEYKTPKKETTFIHFYPTNKDTQKLTKQQTIYLPVYSHVYTSENLHEPMGITLSIRNTDFINYLYIKEIVYYNTYGDLIDSYIKKPHILKPMASIDFVVDLRDMRGGSGANFIIKWAGLENITIPIIQAVMVNNSGNRAFSFITNGHILHKTPKIKGF